MGAMILLSRSRRLLPAFVSKNIILLLFFATLTLLAVSASFLTKCAFIRLRSYFPELKPSTGTWSHHSSIFFFWSFGSRVMSAGINSSLTRFLMFFPRLSNSSANLRISSVGSFSQIWVGSLSCVSPMLTETGTCTFSIVSLSVSSFR